MRRVLYAALAAFVSSAGVATAQDAFVTAQNVQIVGDTAVKFDVFVRANGSPFTLDAIGDVAVRFDQTKFTNPTANVSLSLSGAYKIAATQLGSDYVVTQYEEDLGSPDVTISNSGNGTKIMTITINGLTGTSGTPGIQFNRPPFTVNLFRVGNSTPLSLDLGSFPSINLSPQFEAAIKNQQLLNNEYTFDVFVKATGDPNSTPTFYLGTSDFNINFDNTQFTAPSYSVVSTSLNANYDVAISSVAPGVIGITVESPTASNQTQFDSRVLTVPTSGDGIKVGTFKITGVNNGVSVDEILPAANPWNTGSSLLQFRQRRSPWNLEFSMANTSPNTFTKQAPQFFVDVTQPAGGERLCPSSNFNIQWASQNITNVKVELVSGGSVVQTLTNSVSAPGGVYTWNIPASITSGTYSVRVTSVNNSSLTDESASFSVLAPAVVTDQPVGSTICEGEDYTFSASATGSDVVYQWYKGNSMIAGANSATLLIEDAELSDAGNYYAVVSNDCGSASTSTVSLVVNQGTAITAQPASMNVEQGSTATFSVAAVGTGLAYQWQYSSTNTMYADITGATSSSYSIVDAQLVNEGYYRVVVSGVCGQVTSNSAFLNVIPNVTPITVKVFYQLSFNGTSQVRLPIAVELRESAGTNDLNVSTLAGNTTNARKTAMLESNGQATVQFDGIPTGSYWLVVRCGGAHSIASAQKISITQGVPLSYDFTDALTKYFGGNATAVQAGSVFVVRAGDVNGDRIISTNTDIVPLLGNNGRATSVPAP